MAHDRVDSAVSSSPEEGTPTSQFVGFQLADQEYAFPIEKIQEILIANHVTRVPQVADYVEGVSNLRGTIIPIINLRCLLGMDRKTNDDQTRIIVVNVGSKTMGCCVDSVSQVVRFSNDNIQPAPDHFAPPGCQYVGGFATLGEKLVILLDINQLLAPEKLDEIYRAALMEKNPKHPETDATEH